MRYYVNWWKLSVSIAFNYAGWLVVGVCLGLS